MPNTLPSSPFWLYSLKSLLLKHLISPKPMVNNASWMQREHFHSTSETFVPLFTWNSSLCIVPTKLQQEQHPFPNLPPPYRLMREDNVEREKIKSFQCIFILYLRVLYCCIANHSNTYWLKTIPTILITNVQFRQALAWSICTCPTWHQLGQLN